MRTRVKICGITRGVDAAAAVAAGADAIGLVFYVGSPRNVSLEQAAEIAAQVSAFVTVTGLFVNAEPAFVDTVLDQVPLGLLQFHGNEPAAQCRRFGLPYVKAVGIDGLTDFERFAAVYHDAAGLLLDSHGSGEVGGTGRTFDWKRFPRTSAIPLILAGGLKPENVAEAIQAVRPYAVDLSSGVESAPGIKDGGRIRMLMNEVKRVDCEY